MPAAVEAPLLPLPVSPVLATGPFRTPTLGPMPVLPVPELPVLLPKFAIPILVELTLCPLPESPVLLPPLFRTPTLVPAGRFDLTARGKVNTYALFAELFAGLASRRGRTGVIVPTGIATDATTAPFFAALVAEERLAQIVDFENRAGLFPAVDSRMKFSLLTIERGAARSRCAD
jgi:hypothetical protein